jgi:hypothetical protein
MGDTLKATYNAINVRSTPMAQDELNGPTTYCKAIWAVDGWHEYKLSELFEVLEPLKMEGVFFDLFHQPGKLHWTLFQLQTFPAKIDNAAKYEEEANALKKVIYSFPHLTLHFIGISKTRYGIFLNGYPNFDVNKLRDKIRTNIPGCVEPHPQDICHATLFRFTTTPSEKSLALIDKVVERFKNVHIADCIPKTWEYGFGTWLQKERKILSSWPAVPRWILHRGLISGPDSALENHEALLKQRLEMGWEVEVDVWSLDGVLWLGHDRPTTRLEDISLLAHPGVWVHLKNLEAASKLPDFAHCFIHDTDPAVFTSKGFLWCYPGNLVTEYNRCVIVLPERAGFKFPLLGKVKAVCSDYLPAHFLE